jgi:hypothetical protein
VCHMSQIQTGKLLTFHVPTSLVVKRKKKKKECVWKFWFGDVPKNSSFLGIGYLCYRRLFKYLKRPSQFLPSNKLQILTSYTQWK